MRSPQTHIVTIHVSNTRKRKTAEDAAAVCWR